MNKIIIGFLLSLSFSVLASSETETASIRNSIKASIPQLKYCLQPLSETSKTPEISKIKIVLQFTIGSEGRVVKSTFLSDEIKSEKVIDCMKNVLQGIQFIIPANGKSLDVNQPMSL